MSAFFLEDTVAFNADPDIIASIESTWSDVDQVSAAPSEGNENCYIHKNLPNHVKYAWLGDGRLLPGYVVVQFLQDYDGYCLVSEDSLNLVDRSFAAGDVVKKYLSDAQSGTIISTALMCDLRPLCSEADYIAKETIPAQGYVPSHGPCAPRRKAVRDRYLHGFPRTIRSPLVSLSHRQQAPPYSSLQVPAHELTHWKNYREEDFVIYRDWVGQVRSIYDEVTIRLMNGSVVVVEDPDELDQPYWIPGTASYELVQRLDRAGYYRAANIIRENGKPRSVPAEPCFPGQRVQTKKGNLRRGRWTFGAYDPSVSPEGIVVDVRCVELEIRWLHPNQNLPLRSQANPPPSSLDLDDLGSGEINVYNRSRLPVNRTVDQLSNASYSPDTGFGHRVRFKDPVGAAIKYGNIPIDPDIDSRSSAASADSSRALGHHFDRIPRAATQGFDMNVLLVTTTSTKVMVRWQDCSITEEDSVQLHPYLNPNEDDVWPGDKVSLKAVEEILTANSAASVRAHKVGVVQWVDASGRIAQVRWFQDAKIDMDDERSWQIHGSKYGKLGDEATELPLYDIAAHQAMMTNRGDLVVILPVTDTSQPPPSNGLRTALHSLFGFHPDQRATHAEDLDEVAQSVSGHESNTPSQVASAHGVEWFGEVTEVCLDGGVVVRLGAAHEARDVKFPPDSILVVASDDTDSDSEDTDDKDDEDNDLYWSDEMEVSGADTDHDTDPASAVDISYEYEGGEKLTTDDDEEMWSTDEGDVVIPSPSPVATREDDRTPPLKYSSNTDITKTRQLGILDRAISYSKYPSMPAQFALLDSSPPTDHHYISKQRPLTADLMRRIMKETEIMRETLPDGIFVRSWGSRLDLLRVLIVGPHDTPYEFAPFVIDLHYGASFPNSSPDAFFHSWTYNVGRINPNLYEDGRICLSLLGTWEGDSRNEEWSSKNSTILQLLVSLMGLVLVKEPYYNEAGFDVLIGSAESQVPSAVYSEKVYVMSKAFVKTVLSVPPQGLEDVVDWLYLAPSPQGPTLLRRVVEDSRRLLPENMDFASASGETSLAQQPSPSIKLSAGALIVLRRNLASLENLMERNEGQKL